MGRCADARVGLAEVIWTWALCVGLALGPGEIARAETMIVGQIDFVLGFDDEGHPVEMPIYGQTPWVLEAETTGFEWNDAEGPVPERGEVVMINIVNQDEAGNRAERCEND